MVIGDMRSLGLGPVVEISVRRPEEVAALAQVDSMTNRPAIRH